jgi:hypothetical protein
VLTGSKKHSAPTSPRSLILANSTTLALAALRTACLADSPICKLRAACNSWQRASSWNLLSLAVFSTSDRVVGGAYGECSRGPVVFCAENCRSEGVLKPRPDTREPLGAILAVLSSLTLIVGVTCCGKSRQLRKSRQGAHYPHLPRHLGTSQDPPEPTTSSARGQPTLTTSRNAPPHL